nr:reverse transcriptase domain-containing protein [Tanacetum cinerariifolium]
MANNRTMEEMLQAPTEGYEDAIVVPDILAANFKIRTMLLSLIQANQFHGFESNNLYDHIRSFNRITSTLKFRNGPNDAIKLMLFSYSLKGTAKVWYEKEPPRSILTWGDLVSKFVNHFFPPSKTTHLKSEITRFTQKFKETFGEAWERFKEMLKQCPHHGFSELHQIDTFYNGLNEHDQDSLNAVAGGNLLNKTPQDVLTIIENKSKVRYSRNKSVASKVITTSSGSSSSTDARIDKLTDTILNLVETFNKKMNTPATTKGVEETCVICGDAHPYYDCIATDSNTWSACVATGTYNQRGPQNHDSNQISPPGFPLVQNNQSRYNQNQNQSYNQNRGNYQVLIQHPQVEPPNEFLSYKKITETIIRAMQNQITNLKAEMKNEIHSSMQNQINNVKNELRSDISNQTNELRNMMASFFQKNTASTLGSGPLPSNTIANPRGDLKAITTRSGVSYDGPPIPPLFFSTQGGETGARGDKGYGATEYRKHPIFEKLRKKDDKLALKFVEIFRKLHFNLSFADALLHMPKFAIMFKSLLNNKEKLFDLATTSVNENCSAGGDFILEEIEACLTSKSILPGIDDTDFDLEGDIRLLEKLLNEDPSSFPLPPKELNVEEIKTIKSSIDEPPELKLKDLPSHLEYKDHFPLPFIDQMLECLAGNEFYCFLDGFSGYFLILIDPQNQEKTTFTCPYGTFAYRHMPFGLCNAPGTFQSCMMAIFHDMIEETIEKCHFMVKEGIVLGHKISKSRIEVDKAKVDVIAKLPYPTSIKEKELLAVVYAFKKFRPHLVLSKTIVYADHSALKYLLAKQDAKPRLLRLENPYQGELEKKEITETFPLETLGMISFCGNSSTPWISPDLETSRARGFVLRSLELQSLAYGNLIS